MDSRRTRDECFLRYQVWGNEGEELTRGYNFSFLPEFRKMALVSGYEVIGARLVRTFKEYVVIRIARGFDRTGGMHNVGVILDELEKLPTGAFADTQLRAR